MECQCGVRAPSTSFHSGWSVLWFASAIGQFPFLSSAYQAEHTADADAASIQVGNFERHAATHSCGSWSNKVGDAAEASTARRAQDAKKLDDMEPGERDAMNTGVSHLARAL